MSESWLLSLHTLNINISTLLQLPGNFGSFWKDCQGYYLGCNEVAAEKTRLSSRQDVIGRSDFDLSVLRPDEARLIREGDQIVLATQKPQYFLYTASGSEVSNIFITMKAPLWDQDRNMVGIYGIDFFTNELNETLCLPLLEKTGISISEYKKILAKIRGAQKEIITKRQIDCLYFLVRGLTIKGIARELNLAAKTVEHYLNAAKIKLNCRSRAELIQKSLMLPIIRNKLNL